VIGALGTELGRNNVNISRMTVGREVESKQNIIFLGTDQMVTKEILEQVRAIENINDALVFDL
jgi:D-3-phosphoglycerate dehydrogenase